MRRIDLHGEWTVRKAGAKKAFPASVPGCVHADLIAAGELVDPLSRSQFESCGWVAESEWIYEKVFVAEDLSGFERVLLRMDGLEGRAVVSLNDEELGFSESAFASAEYEVKRLLRAGKNRLSVTFAAAGRAAERRPEWRAEPSAGIWRGVALLAFSTVRVRDVVVRQDFGAQGVVGLDVTVDAELFEPALHLEVLVRVCYKGNILHEARDLLAKERATLRLNVKNPQLWWPAGLGEQPLYEVTVDILAGRSCLEHISRRIGLRQLSVEAGESGGAPSYRFCINRHPLFLKGASWLPADLYAARLTRVEYARLIKAAAVANMNVLRVWGGGVYESDAFYDLCDEYGVCLWHDVVAREAREGEPGGPGLLAREAEQNVRRLRHHPSLIAWCGGSGAAVGAIADADADRPCLPPTAHEPFSLGGGGCAAALPAFPEPRAVSAYLGEDERNVNHPACVFHSTPADSLRLIYSELAQHFLFPCCFENALWLSQIQQGWLLKLRMERARAAERGAGGFVFWHLNDGRPACSASTLDWGGRWKAAHYMARRFFAPLWLCGEYRAEAGVADVHVFNDGVKAFKGELQWRVTLMDGSLAAEGTKKVSVAPAGREKPAAVKVQELLRKHGAENLVLWLYLLDEQGNQASWNFVLFCEPRELRLLPPRMRAEIRSWDDNSFAVTLTSHHPAMWVWISLDGMDARYDENFFCMEPEKPVRVRVTPSSRLKLDQFRQLVRIGSLRDTWQEKRTLMQMMAAPKK
jgi:beta-mannosidase